MAICSALRLALGLAALSAAPAAAAEMLPLWEAGVGAGVVSLPDYRGSDERRNFLLPVPYLIYRGDFLKADRDGVRGVLFDTRRVELDISVGLSPPVDSGENRARAGMADLEAVAEVGPNLEITLWEAEGARLKFKAPFRGAFTVDSSPQGVGWVFSPRLNLDIDDLGASGWRLGLLSGPIYATRAHHAYFYSVADADVTPARPRYDAPGGYAGTQFLASLSKRFPRAWVGAFLRWDTLAGAAFGDSPLMRSRDYLAGGIAFAWVFGESMQRVEATR
jgi:outer membrane scaffolding protein for murein synthesis (MipA/OmpV family)